MRRSVRNRKESFLAYEISTGEEGIRYIFEYVEMLYVSFSLVKMLYWMCEKSGRPPTWPQLEHAIRRNFGGIELDELDTLEEFKSRIQVKWTPDLQSISEEVML